MDVGKSIKDHMDESDQVKKLVDEANALLGRAREELATIREVLTSLRDFQHPKMLIRRADTSYLTREVANCGDRDFTPAHLIDRQVARINALLGDRP